MEDHLLHTQEGVGSSPTAPTTYNASDCDDCGIMTNPAVGESPIEIAIRVLGRAGYSVPRIAELTGVPVTAVRRIAARLGVTSLHSRKFIREDAYDYPTTASVDLELEAQRGRAYRGGYPYELRPADYCRPQHGPVRIYRPGPNGELVLVEEVPV